MILDIKDQCLKIGQVRLQHANTSSLKNRPPNNRDIPRTTLLIHNGEADTHSHTPSILIYVSEQDTDMATTKTATSENALKHPQQLQLAQASGDRQQQTSHIVVNTIVEESSAINGCVTQTAAKEGIDEVEQHTQKVKNNKTYSYENEAAQGTADTPATPVVAAMSVMVMNEAPESRLCGKKLLLCRRFKDCGGILRNFNSLPLFVYATSPSTHAISADGVGVAKEAAAAADAIVQKVSKYLVCLQ